MTYQVMKYQVMTDQSYATGPGRMLCHVKIRFTPIQFTLVRQNLSRLLSRFLSDRLAFLTKGNRQKKEISPQGAPSGHITHDHHTEYTYQRPEGGIDSHSPVDSLPGSVVSRLKITIRTLYLPATALSSI